MIFSINKYIIENLASEAQKLKIMIVPSLDDLVDIKKWEFKGYDSFFSCLGSEVGKVKVINLFSSP